MLLEAASVGPRMAEALEGTDDMKSNASRKIQALVWG